MAIGQILDIAQELQDDHRKARDGLLDLVKACQAQDGRQAREIVGFIDILAGPHWRWEEEALYPTLRRFSEELADSLLNEHDTVIAGVARLTAIFNKRGGLFNKKKMPSDGEWAEARKLIPGLLYHVATCDGLPIMIEKFSQEEISSIKQAVFAARKEGVPLLEWAERLRQRQQ